MKINHIITNRSAIIQAIRETPYDRQWLYAKIFFKGMYLTTKNRVLMFYLYMVGVYNSASQIGSTENKYKIIGAIDIYGRDISLPVKAYFNYIDLPTTQSLEQYLGYDETIILFMCIDGKPTQLSIDLENRRIIEQDRSLIGGLITFDDEDEEIAELSE